MLTADFHIHTKYSHDSYIEPSDILKVSKKMGIDILGIADHNTNKGAIVTKKLSKEILVLVGQEIKTEYGDLIVFGSNENISGGLYDILDKASSENLFTILPHPFDILRSSAIGNNLKDLSEVLKKINAIEVFNARCYFNYSNLKAQNVAKTNKIPGVAASDAHFLGEIKNAKNYIDCEKKEDSVYEAIKKNKLCWEGKKTKNIFKLKALTGRIKRKIT